jgi:hypothetical protein
MENVAVKLIKRQETRCLRYQAFLCDRALSPGNRNWCSAFMLTLYGFVPRPCCPWAELLLGI